MKKAQGLPFPHYYTEQYSSGVSRVSSAQGPMLASAPPPPKKKLAPPAHRIGLHGWHLRGLGCAPPRLASATALCNEVTLLICLGLIFFLQLGPTSWAGAPSKACARGHGPPPPLARHCNIVGLLKSFKSVEGCYPKTPIDDCRHSICPVNHQAKLYG